NQGSCGSCYAFGAAAAAEGTYNVAEGFYDDACADFSESFIMWCLGTYGPYSSHFDGCAGADYAYEELHALTVEGIIDEASYPYTMEDPGECAHWDVPREVFASWHRIPCGDINAIKTAIMMYGVVDAAVYAGYAFTGYTGGVYDDTYTECSGSPCSYTTTNHAIALVGWDDNPPEGGGGCWILRNSWGEGWGEDGYMRIRYNAAAVACAACYLVYESEPTPTPTVTPTPTASWTPTLTPTPTPTPTMTPTWDPSQPTYTPTATPTNTPDPVVFTDDMEDGEGGWTHYAVTPGYNDEWHLSSEKNHTPGGTYSWKCGSAGAGVYSDYDDSALVTADIDIFYAGCVLTFWHWIEAEMYDASAAFDGAIVEI
ncbi:MAG: C1 family peptidase, partial [bacterium]